jgi:hypothetical protein
MMAVEMRAVGRFLLRGTRRAAITVAGFAIVCLGVAGLVLPILPGWVLIIAGFAVLSREYSWAHSALAFARRKAARSGATLRSLARRRRRIAVIAEDSPEHPDFIPSGEVVIDLTQPSALTGTCPRGGSG